MSLLRCISAEAEEERWRLLLVANFAGLANVLILVSINASAHAAEQRDGSSLVKFLALIALYALCSRHAKRRMSSLIGMVVHRIRVRVGDRVAGAELAVLERIQASEICDLITENTMMISDRAGFVAVLLQSSVILAFAVIYIACLSLPALMLLLVICLVAAGLFVGMRRDLIRLTQQNAGTRVGFMERLMDLLAGFKELQFSRRRGSEVRAEAVAASDALRAATIRSSDLLNDGLLIGEGVLLVLVIAVVYLHQGVAALDAGTITHLLAAVMFLWGPLMGVIGGIMPYMRSNMALAQIDDLEGRLDAVVREAPTIADEDPWHGRAHGLVAAGVAYRYPAHDDGDAPFCVGPLDLEFVAGEVVFIVGGNGSGKSTLVKVLTGLYVPSEGQLRLDGVVVGAANVAAFRDMIAAIFSDFYLFPRLYGLGERDAEANLLIEQMQLTGKVALADGAFTTLALSTGQRKRLAMIVALLEDRPICVFDEWAADQDPEFRQYFYAELLPQLRARGKMVLVVSHDDRYFHCADKVVTLEYGRLRALEHVARDGAAP
ncbi:cyclic peptide export ABC transporter [Nannocystis radixulma]|uniref:Cyclic peptide export ABC transporter n=1 Tax=Nannocystis radixulma TaxID=2995305 RepID=A0ABT5B1N7_9BACT|nr:cyclic peptide export ABC transporter [Nannocystis radixulma]MDC0667992.1 cyclic peptide export ABC transporter [Nannocystis radixulma]